MRLSNYQTLSAIFILVFIFTNMTRMIKSTFFRPSKSPYDVTIVGSVKFADGLGRLSVGFIDYLKNDLKINFISSRQQIDLKDIPLEVINVIKDKNKVPGNVAILFDPVWYQGWSAWKHVPASIIKIAYSMLESTAIPSEWVSILNKQFDAVVVPSPFLVQVYQNSGVKKPIFVMPHGIYIEEFLNKPIKRYANEPFVFGMSAGFWPHKNHVLLLKAFIKEFGNKPKVKLILHGRFGNPEIINKVIRKIKKYKLTNVEIINKSFSQREYLKFMENLDCYVLVSKGEGFSVTPRESLALGLPCIISYNTAHNVICQTDLCYCVPSYIKEPADYRANFGIYSGYNFNCNIEDLQKALQEIYQNYEHYLEKAKIGRIWVQQYLYKNLKNKYLTLIKPKEVFLGPINTITDNYIMTDSTDLYRKYKLLLQITKEQVI